MVHLENDCLEDHKAWKMQWARSFRLLLQGPKQAML